MSDFQAITDRVEIEALWGEFTGPPSLTSCIRARYPASSAWALV
jgi:hypothetical protein